MTIEERGEAYANKIDSRDPCHYVIKMAHIHGATEQKAIDIDKACEIFDNAKKLGLWNIDFRKAMEE